MSRDDDVPENAFADEAEETAREIRRLLQRIADFRAAISEAKHDLRRGATSSAPTPPDLTARNDE